MLTYLLTKTRKALDQLHKSKRNFVYIIFMLLIPLHEVQASWLGGQLSSIWDGAKTIGKFLNKTPGEAIGDAAGALFDITILWITKLFFLGSGWFMEMMGYVLDTSISFTLSSKIYKSVEAIQVGWTAVRDFSNMFFIFVLLYIAILTVLGMAGSNAKRWVAHLVIAALLINFSLFATQVVVDAGNVLAIGFWDKMTMKEGNVTAPTASKWFMEGFRIQTEFDTSKSLVDTSGKAIDLSVTNRVLIYLGGTAINLIAGYVFLAGAVMMIIRSVTLMILMIVSPFAFLGFALPKGGSFAGQWLSKLIGSTFVAPAFIFMLYIDSLIIRGVGVGGSEVMKATGADKSNIAYAIAGSAANLPIIYNFILMVMLLLAALKVADSVSSGAGSAAGKWAKTGLGGGAAAGAAGVAYIRRRTTGKDAMRQLENPDLHRRATLVGAVGSREQIEGDRARKEVARLTKLSTSTMDVRSTGIGKGITSLLAKTGIDTGGPKAKTFAERTKVGGEGGSYEGGLTKREKEVEDEAKKAFPDNPEAQKQYIEGKLGKAWTETRRNKKAKEALDASASKKAAETANKADFENGMTTGKADNAKLAELKKQERDLMSKGLVADAALVKSIADTAKSVEDANDTVRKAMLQMTGEDVTKLMMDKDKNYGEQTAFRQGLTGKDYTSINKAYQEGKFKESMGNKDKVLMENLTTEALMSEKTPEATKRMIKNAMKNGTWAHEIDFKKQIEQHIANGSTDAEFDETWKMLDNEDKAELKGLLLNERVAERLNGATLGAMSKKGNEGFYDDVPDFRNKLEDLHKRGVIGNAATKQGRVNTAATHIDKNRKKQENYFYDMPQTAAASAAASGWKISVARMSSIEGDIKRHYSLSEKLSALSLTPAETAEYQSLKTKINGLAGDEKSYADEVKSKL